MIKVFNATNRAIRVQLEQRNGYPEIVILDSYNVDHMPPPSYRLKPAEFIQYYERGSAPAEAEDL